MGGWSEINFEKVRPEILLETSQISVFLSFSLLHLSRSLFSVYSSVQMKETEPKVHDNRTIK